MEVFGRLVIVLFSFFLVWILGYTVTSVISDKIIAYKHDEAWNKRGFIGCKDGHGWIMNIDISGPVKQDKFVVNYDALDCETK